MRHSRIFVAAAAVAMVAFGALYYHLFRYQFGAPIPASYDVSYWITWKKHLAENTPGKRLLIVGDSSSLFGVDSEALGKAIGRPVVNMSLHGGLPLDWLTRFAEKHARAGDIVVMPLSWPYYRRDYKVPEAWMVNQMVAWDGQFFEDSDPMQKLRYIAAMKPADLLRNARAVEESEMLLKQNPARKLIPEDEVIENMERAQHGPVTGNFDYSYLKIGPHGDMRGACGFVNPQSSPVVGSGPANKNELAILSKASKAMAEAGATLVIMPPPTVADAQALGPVYQAALDEIFVDLRRTGLRTAGQPRDFYLPSAAFYDTPFHVNCEHAAVRTQRMAEALLKAFPGLRAE
jgi:hypothetical protein